MTSLRDGEPLPVPLADPRLCAALADDFRAAGYTASALREAWGKGADDAVGASLVRPALRALAGDVRPLAVIARLLFLGRAEPADAVDAALPRTRAEGLCALGLARREGARLIPTALVRPQEAADALGEISWWIASDLDEAALGGALPTDHVLGVGGASLTLAGLQLDTPATRVLDVGSGCGIQSLRARRAAQQVVATDVSPRALAFTELNALLNAVDGIQTRRGSLFEPVAGEKFDRVVSNPPFVITPRVAGVPAYEYRDGGMAGDDLVAAFVSGVGEVLAPGGTAQLLGNWEYRAGADGLDRVRAWVAASPVPLEAWVIERERLDPLAYAQLWVRDGGSAPGDTDYEDLIDAWLTDFAQRGVEAIGFGYILLRRAGPDGPRLARYERLTQPMPDGLGAHFAQALTAWDVLARLDDDALSARLPVVAPDVTEARHHRPGEEAPTIIELRQGGGCARTIIADPGLAALVGASDGELPVGILIAAIAELLEVDAEALRAELLPEVRELVFAGLLQLV